jgi:MoxR-like ATPase
MSNIKIQILAFGSTSAICAAAADLLGLNTLSKITAVNALAEKIEQGYFDLNTVKQTIMNRSGGVQSTQAAPAVNAVAIRAEATALQVKADLASLSGEFGSTRIDLNKKVDGLEKSIQTLRDRADSSVGEYNRVDNLISGIHTDIKGVYNSAVRAENLAAQAIDLARTQQPAAGPDPAQVAAAVASAVAVAFKPFEQAVIDAGAQAQVGALVSAQVAGVFPAKNVFGFALNDSKGKPVEFAVWDHADAPEIDNTFIWTESVLSHLAYAERFDLNLWFGGSKGTGKTVSAQQYAARTGRKFVRINFHKYTEPSDYLGGTGILNGNTEFQAQDFLSAYTTPGCVILLDEVCRASAGCLAPLNGLLEPRAAVNIGGHVWRKAPGVIIIAADNSMGNGDDSGRYAGVQLQDSAFGERFAASMKFEFLSLKQETQAVVNHTGCNPLLAKHILGAVNLARSKVDTGDIVDAPSIRCVIAYIRALSLMPPAQAWASCIAARQPVEGAAALEAIRISSIDETAILGWI